MTEQAHWPLLDAMRGVAAVAVVWFHLHFVVGYDCAGPLAVDLFFMLSGFVVAAAYDARLDHDLSFSAFCRKRMFRLYPLFLVGLVVALLVQQILILRGAGTLSERDSVMSFAFEAFWLPSPFNGGSGWTFPIDGPAWSLSLEIAVNLLFAGFHQRMSNGLLAGIVAVGGLALIAGVATFGTINFGWTWQTLPLGFARVGYAFPLGVLMFRYRDHIPQRLAGISPFVPLVLLIALLFDREYLLLDIVFLMIGAPLLIAIGYRSRIGRHRYAFQQLGAISYPLYAIHGSLVLLVQGADKLLNLQRWGLAVGTIALISMTLLSLPLAKWDAQTRAMLTAGGWRLVLLPRRRISH